MTRRTKRSFSQSDAQEMLAASKEFQSKLRVWLAQTPLRTPAYVGLSALNQSLEVTQRAIQGDYDALIRLNYDGGPPE